MAKSANMIKAIAKTIGLRTPIPYLYHLGTKMPVDEEFILSHAKTSMKYTDYVKMLCN